MGHASRLTNKPVSAVLLSLINIAPSIAAPLAVPQSKFCPRFAAEFDLKPGKTKAGVDIWQRQLFGLGAFLVGGTAGVSFRFTPAPTTMELSPAEQTDCQMLPKGALKCTIVSPGVLEVGIKDKVASVAAQPNERAEVRVTNSKVECEDK